jgi:hypothetical protein
MKDTWKFLLFLFLQDVRIDNLQSEDGCVYFEQLGCKAGSFKIGDCVYARSAKDKPVIGRIEKIWTNQM